MIRYEALFRGTIDGAADLGLQLHQVYRIFQKLFDVILKLLELLSDARLDLGQRKRLFANWPVRFHLRIGVFLVERVEQGFQIRGLIVADVGGLDAAIRGRE